MDAIEAIMTRRSIRKYTDTPITDDQVKQILSAAMAAPTAGNQQAWEFVVITDRKVLNALPDVHPYSRMLLKAPAAVLVCGNLETETKEGYFPQDCAAATQNILLAANALGLGAVWLGVHPREERVTGIRKLLRIPDHVVPVSLVALGHPAESHPRVDRYDEKKVHKDTW
ncbi:MAG: nitroreductase family protein [Deltaproteobacteria bacterium]|nr:nitroreductase family protein [Candidatus Zymogenaceae bacterium]